MKVLHVLMNGHIGGGQTIACRIALHLLEQGAEVCVLSPARGPLTETLARAGIPVFIQPMRRTYHLHEALAIARFIRKERIDVVHTHSLGAGNILSRLGGWLAKRPVISHVHGENNFNPNPIVAAYQRSLEKLTLGTSRKIIAVSEQTRHLLLGLGAHPKKIEVIPNGVEIPESIPDANASVRKEFSIPEEWTIAVCVGQLCETKGQALFIEALALLPPGERTLAVLFAGEDLQNHGRYRETLEHLSAKLGVSNAVRFAGFREDVNRLLQASNFLVLPSRVEGSPMVILEAMANARAVIASAVGGIPELIDHGKSGLLVPAGDKSELARALLSLLREPNLGRRLGEAGRTKVREKHPSAAMLSRIMKIYDTVLTNGRTHWN